MYYTPADMKERHAFVDNTIEAANTAFAEPEAVRALGGLAVGFRERLDAAKVANVFFGQIYMPNWYEGEDVLPIAAVRPDESFVLSDFFDAQTDLQRFNTLQKFIAWEPLNSTPEQLYESFLGMPIDGRHHEPITMQGITTAMTGAYTVLIDAEHTLSSSFSKAPSKGLALAKFRPILLIRMFPGTTKVDPDLVAHELIHEKHIQEKPIQFYVSQRAVDMRELRGELEAYHVGSIFSVPEVRKNGNSAMMQGHNTYRLVQIMVENIRNKHGIDPIDPYKPTPELLQKIRAQIPVDVLHGRIDYDNIMDALGLRT